MARYIRYGLCVLVSFRVEVHSVVQELEILREALVPGTQDSLNLTLKCNCKPPPGKAIIASHCTLLPRSYAHAYVSRGGAVQIRLRCKCNFKRGTFLKNTEYVHNHL